MKRILLLLSIIIGASSLFSQSRKVIFLEEFTQASCPPCEATTPALNAVVNANIEKVVQIRYQTSWPGVDPMNADNPEEVQTRVNFYGVTGVPTFIIDGTPTANNSVPTQAAFDDSFGEDTAPIAVTISHELSEDLTTMDVSVSVTNEGVLDYDLSNDKLRVALIEEEISWPYRPGSTSIQVFEAVMKTFFTTPAGMDMPAVAAGETWEMSWTELALPEVIYDYNELAVVAFIQNDSDNEVINAALSEPIELTGYADLSVTNLSTVTGGLCDSGYSPSALVVNNSDLPVSGFNVVLLINGNEVDNVTVEDEIAGDGTYQVDFDEINLPSGSSQIVMAVDATGGQDIAILNNITEADNASKAGLPGDDISKEFESDVAPSAPSGMIVETATNTFVVSADALGLSTPIGGYANSDNSVRVNLYQWDPSVLGANGSLVVADQLIVESAFSSFSFDYAFTTWGGSQDGMEVQVSTDCGGNYETVWNKVGSELATAPELNNPQGAFVPAATEWVTESVDLSDYVGETVLVRFYFTSGWGDMMYIDNIAAVGVSSIDDLEENEAVSVYPNPASNVVALDININEAADINIKMVDMLGKVIKNEQLGQAISGQFSTKLDVTDLEAGSYVLYLNIGEKEVVRRISVAR